MFEIFAFFWSIALGIGLCVLYATWPRTITDNPCGRPAHERRYTPGRGYGEDV